MQMFGDDDEDDAVEYGYSDDRSCEGSARKKPRSLVAPQVEVARDRPTPDRFGHCVINSLRALQATFLGDGD
jgi:hypothetical protein